MGLFNTSAQAEFQETIYTGIQAAQVTYEDDFTGILDVCVDVVTHVRLLGRLQQIQHREQENPHQIDEVPVEAGRFDPVDELFLVRGPHRQTRTEEVAVDRDTTDDMETV